MRGWPSPGQAGTVLINPKRPGSKPGGLPRPSQGEARDGLTAPQGPARPSAPAPATAGPQGAGWRRRCPQGSASFQPGRA